MSTAIFISKLLGVYPEQLIFPTVRVPDYLNNFDSIQGAQQSEILQGVQEAPTYCSAILSPNRNLWVWKRELIV